VVKTKKQAAGGVVVVSVVCWWYGVDGDDVSVVVW
jgi:hypothetical protein